MNHRVPTTARCELRCIGLVADSGSGSKSQSNGSSLCGVVNFKPLFAAKTKSAQNVVRRP